MTSCRMTIDDRVSASRVACWVTRCDTTVDTNAMRSSIATLGSLVEWVPVCPEVEAGMGTPREAIDLIASDDGVPQGRLACAS